jgi:uncharacterized protein YceK
MKTPLTMILATALLGGCASTLPQAGSGSGYESAALPTSMAGQWHGTAIENYGYHGGTGAATLTLDLKPDGTWTQTWNERGREVSDSGRWVMRGNAVVLESSEGMHRRQTLRRHPDGLYGVIDKSLVGTRTTPMTIEFHRAETNQSTQN